MITVRQNTWRKREKADAGHQKAMAQKKKVAQAIVHKMTPVMSALTPTLEKPQLEKLPLSVRSTGEEAYAGLKAIQRSCNVVISEQSIDEELIGLKQLTSKLGQARKIDALLTGMFASAATQ